MIDTLSYKVIGCAIQVYNILGPGLIESVYENALLYELQSQGIHAEAQVPVNVTYRGFDIGEGLRIDILVENKIILELKSVETITPLHYKQLITYLKLTGLGVGYLINFNVDDFAKGYHRVVNNYEDFRATGKIISNNK